jgi:hypothetical protein
MYSPVGVAKVREYPSILRMWYPLAVLATMVEADRDGSPPPAMEDTANLMISISLSDPRSPSPPPQILLSSLFAAAHDSLISA